ncbi:hypothetical protein GA830_18865 (plasmid) [Mesorhizobium sp. NBSH29]|uniref:hypothetical protein n=1 Tax=Mesorhizobium sp. NBSH29 TaxID=2654249 RepID=UPI0018969014|nr:hypothetical protein [Mesorhizobium sp. NBSH29]QPC88917.1 hypothetical protein GA830_18865 [Mesorhizobium sp. NBSH29]
MTPRMLALSLGMLCPVGVARFGEMLVRKSAWRGGRAMPRVSYDRHFGLWRTGKHDGTHPGKSSITTEMNQSAWIDS